MRTRFLLAMSLGLCCCAAATASAGEYAVVKTLKIGGDGRWDYITVDPATKRLFISRSSHTQVVNADDGKLLADLKDTNGVHGVALVPDQNRGFTTNGRDNSTTIFDLKTLQPIGTTKTGEGPDGVLYDPFSKCVLTMNGKGHDTSVIDPAAAAGAPVKATIGLGGKPEGSASDGAGAVFVAVEDASSVAVLDMKEMKLVHTWKIEGGEEPSGLALDAEHHHLFLGCGGNNVMAIMDSQSGKTLGTVPIGKGVDYCAFDPGTGEAFASCGDGTLTVVKETSPGKFEVTQTVKTAQGARTMALDPATHTIYLPTAEFQPATGGGRPQMKAGTFMVVVVAPK
ncbi:MAG TPA: hypothetical protein VLI90_17865 [Tepidisphaeraceae bacterium]|nr:hypothetical protein [Tepidisphaeraceae bacterium]